MRLKLISALYKRNRRSTSEEPIYWLLVRNELNVEGHKCEADDNADEVPFTWPYFSRSMEREKGRAGRGRPRPGPKRLTRTTKSPENLLKCEQDLK